ncbi:hypothetical protein BU16DRAFT_545180 [Lophium mytilinum]|uniref:Uncharacterized protein n=1 Tax=Lophium mytilinum TaxID=390894 RepID=A0A6A6Q8G1_9PEZI|nr:hypothetical protein BU16DRAFT_545180 [Lophium mytilinum]
MHVQVHNASNLNFTVPRNVKLGVIIDCFYEGAYSVDVDEHSLAVQRAPLWQPQTSNGPSFPLLGAYNSDTYRIELADVQTPDAHSPEASVDVYAPVKDVYAPVKDVYAPVKDVYEPVKDVYEPLNDITPVNSNAPTATF